MAFGNLCFWRLKKFTFHWVVTVRIHSINQKDFLQSEARSIDDSLDLPVPENVVVESCGLSFGESGYFLVNSKIVSQIVFIFHFLDPNLHTVFKNILKRLEIHFQVVHLVLQLLYLFLVNVALVHKPIFMLFIHLFLIYCHLVYLSSIKNYCVFLHCPFVHQWCYQCLLFLYHFLVGENVFRYLFFHKSFQFVIQIFFKLFRTVTYFCHNER